MFYMLMLEQDTIRKRRMNMFTEMPEFDPGDNKEYKVETI